MLWWSNSTKGNFSEHCKKEKTCLTLWQWGRKESSECKWLLIFPDFKGAKRQRNLHCLAWAFSGLDRINKGAKYSTQLGVEMMRFPFSVTHTSWFNSYYLKRLFTWKTAPLWCESHRLPFKMQTLIAVVDVSGKSVLSSCNLSLAVQSDHARCQRRQS